MESIASGLVAGLNAVHMYERKAKKNGYTNINYDESKIQETEKIIFPDKTMIGALAKYISTENKNFQPMNANFGILPELAEKIKDKKLKYGKLADRALEYLTEILR